MNELPIDEEFYQTIKHLIKKTELKRIQLSELYGHVYSKDGDKYLPIDCTPHMEYLNGNKEVYKEYHAYVKNNKNENDIHTAENFDKLLTSILERGYDNSNLIVTFNNDNIIRDGQHRAVILYYLHGDHEISILDITL